MLSGSKQGHDFATGKDDRVKKMILEGECEPDESRVLEIGRGEVSRRDAHLVSSWIRQYRLSCRRSHCRIDSQRLQRAREHRKVVLQTVNQTIEERFGA